MLASFIIHKRAWIETVFVIGCLLSLLTMNFVNVNYDLTNTFRTRRNRRSDLTSCVTSSVIRELRGSW